MSTTAPAGNDQYRLPLNVKPTHYDVTVKTDLEGLTFAGLVKINLDVKEDTTKIVLNTSGLDLGSASIRSDALSAVQSLTSSSFDKVQERTTYELSDTLPAGSKAELQIYFSGELTGSMNGYYRSAWEDEGKTKHYALTQFEPTAARRAFPCWDEPLLKATFAVTMISREGTTNLSNMPAISEETIEHGKNVPAGLEELLASTKNEAWKITKFESTPPMSSYIVAFANGPFKYLEDSVKMPISGKTLPLRIYTTPDVIHQAQFALDVKKAVLPLYEKVFDVEYPLPKLDTLVASDFDAGAMENWGLITGRTSAFLLDPNRADLQAKKRVMSVQSHEVAHMWFGNITTMEWWDYLYLNEGFATLMGEVIIPDKVYPEWKVNSQFINEHLNRALDLDSKLSSHPIEVECPDANHVNQIFDALSYSKAASVLRMLSKYVGEEKFLKGVSIYLKKRLFGNSVTHDLWDGISTATGLNITELMENWITKMGFPVLTVTETATGITVRQDRFLETGPANPADNETIWNVPLGLLSTKDGKTTVDLSAILQEREKSFTIDTSQPFKLNAGTTGVYRVLYSPERLALIAAEAAKENSAFSTDDRIGLVHDAMALSQAGFAKVSSALTLVDLWKNEKEYLVWNGIGEALASLVSIWWESPEIVAKLNAFRRALFVPIVKRLGFEYPAGESQDISQLRTLAVGQSAGAGDEGVIKELQGRFQAYVDTGDVSKIPADLLRVTFHTAVKWGGRKEYDAVVALHDKAKTPSEKIASMVAMGASQQEDILKDTLDFITNKSRDQDIFYFFIGLSSNSKARRLLTQYFYDQYDVLVKRFEGNFSLHYLVTYSTQYYSTIADCDAVEAFFKDKDTSKYNQALAQALDTIKARAGYVERSTEDLAGWLGAYDPVRDAVLNSPVERSRRATHLSNLLNSDHDALQHSEPISSRRNSMQLNHITSIPYSPKRITPPGIVMTPLTLDEIEMYKNYRGQGAMLLMKRRRGPSPVNDPERPYKRHTGDVGVVVNHYNSRRDVGVEERSTSPIIGLKNFNNWVKSVLITLWAHPTLAQSPLVGAAGRGRNPPRGKVLDMGCGKGGDINKWSKANVKELFCVDIADVSVQQARSRFEGMKHSRFDAHFAALDCYAEPLSKAFSPAQLSTPFDVVSMQFCMHYAFETIQKARCMLDNVSRYMRTGGMFIGTIPNSQQLLDNLAALPPDTTDLSFGNSIYRITFEDHNANFAFGHKYWFFLQDAVENVPEYVVRWDRFVELAAEYNLYPVYKEEFHQIFDENKDKPELKELMVRMKVIDSEGTSAMDEDQWDAANIYVGFAMQKR